MSPYVGNALLIIIYTTKDNICRRCLTGLYGYFKAQKYKSSYESYENFLCLINILLLDFINNKGNNSSSIFMLYIYVLKHIQK